MKQIKRIISLHCENNLRNRQIAQVAGVSRPMVSEYLEKATGKFQSARAEQ